MDKDLNMIQNPDNWPAWPFLPMKRKTGGQLEMAFFWNGSISDDTVLFFLGYIYEMKPRKSAALKVTPEQVLALGWRVD